MHRFIEIVKSHPYAIGGGVLIGAFLIYMMSRSGSATGGTYAAPAQNSEVELAQVNASLVSEQDAIRMQGNLAQVALQAKQSDNATSLAIAQNASATALAINDNATALSSQQEQDKANVSLLTLASSTALTSQQQGYTAELASQKETDAANATTMQYAHLASLSAQADYNDAGEPNRAGNMMAGLLGAITSAGSYIGFGSSAPGAGSGGKPGKTAQSTGTFYGGTSFTSSQIAAQATAAAGVSNAALQAIYGATVHLTAPASNSPTAAQSST